MLAIILLIACIKSMLLPSVTTLMPKDFIFLMLEMRSLCSVLLLQDLTSNVSKFRPQPQVPLSYLQMKGDGRCRLGLPQTEIAALGDNCVIVALDFIQILQQEERNKPN